MSSTPKTDSQLLTVKDCSYVAPHPAGEYVTAEFARELERENAALREDRARLDWLEETLISLYATPTPDMRGARIRGQLRNKRRDDSGAAGPSYIRLFHASIRAAIDAARKYEGQK